MSNYPFLKISKVVLRIIGVLTFLSTIVLEIIFDSGLITLILVGVLDMCCCDGVEIFGVIVAIISGAISGFMFFVLAEVIDLFVNIGKDVRAIKGKANEERGTE